MPSDPPTAAGPRARRSMSVGRVDRRQNPAPPFRLPAVLFADTGEPVPQQPVADTPGLQSVQFDGQRIGRVVLLEPHADVQPLAQESLGGMGQQARSGRPGRCRPAAARAAGSVGTPELPPAARRPHAPRPARWVERERSGRAELSRQHGAGVEGLQGVPDSTDRGQGGDPPGLRGRSGTRRRRPASRAAHRRGPRAVGAPRCVRPPRCR